MAGELVELVYIGVIEHHVPLAEKDIISKIDNIFLESLLKIARLELFEITLGRAQCLTELLSVSRRRKGFYRKKGHGKGCAVKSPHFIVGLKLSAVYEIVAIIDLWTY